MHDNYSIGLLEIAVVTVIAVIVLGLRVLSSIAKTPPLK